MTTRKKINAFFVPALLAVVFWLIALGLNRNATLEKNTKSVYQKMQQSFLKNEKNLIKIIKLFTSETDALTETPGSFQENFFTETENSGFGFYVFQDSIIVDWSDNTIPLQGHELDLIAASEGVLLQFSNGYYYCISETSSGTTFVGLMPVYYMYPYQNKYLKNGFSPNLESDNSVSIIGDSITGNSIKNSAGNHVFSLKSIPDFTTNRIPFVYVFISFLVSFTFVLIIIKNFIAAFISRSVIVILLLLVFTLIIRFIQIRFLFPGFLYTSELFSPLHFAWNKWFASLGDLITNVYCCLFISIILWLRFRNSVRFFRKRMIRISVLILLSLLIMVDFIMLNLLLEKIIINSTLLLSFDDILKLKPIDFSGFIVIIMMVLSFMYLSFIVIQVIRKNLRYRVEKIIFFFVIILSATGIFLAFQNLLVILLLFILFLTFALGIPRKFFSISGAFGVLCLFLFTFSFGIVLNMDNSEKEMSYRNLYAIQLSNEQDPIGEYQFEEISKNIISDSIFSKELSFSSDPQAFAEDYLRRKYLSGYFTKYNLQVTVCRPNDILLIVSTDSEVSCPGFFESMKKQYGTPTMVPDYWLIDDQTGRPNYLFETSFIVQSENQPDTILVFLEMISIPGITGLGYPELLVEEKVMKRTGRFDYAYAKYFNNELINQFGDFYYPLKLDSSMIFPEPEFSFFDNYHHLIYPTNSKTTIIVSLPERKVFENAATFSYLLIILAVFHYLLIFFLFLFMKMPLFSMFAFKTRLQVASIFLVLLSFFVAGIITVNFFIRYHHNKNREIIREKSFSLLTELEHKFRGYDFLGPEDANYLSDLMTKFSNVFFTDINLYSTSGQLIATSRPQIYQQGLTSTLMNPVAFKKLRESSTPYYLRSESIGKLNYTSSYLPFKNYRNEVIAYLNLPYFARENELQKEISSFLITFMNFYVVLIAFAIIIALVIAGYITLPLRLIGEKLKALKPGQPNEKIRWNKKDDIGVLIEEYNRMVDQLADSTRQLMKSERESAWREMAKQIAHEIKNPLTPMKLSLQNLQRAWNDKAPDYEERLKRTSQTLIEQIEALSQIATEFANFARLQEARLFPVNIIPLIRDTVHLYRTDLISVEFNYDDLQSYIILGDETQLIQIMNNLLKNAVQSVPSKEPGEIVVTVIKFSGKIQICIRDNGCGIADEIREKIFTPNFTSKSGGTGLGLAITKKITDNMGGTITFETELNKGSVFTLTFDEYTENSFDQ